MQLPMWQNEAVSPVIRIVIRIPMGGIAGPGAGQPVGLCRLGQKGIEECCQQLCLTPGQGGIVGISGHVCPWPFLTVTLQGGN